LKTATVEPDPTLTAVLLAAGSSSRLGYPKQLVNIEGQSLVRRSAACLAALPIRELIVVTGAGEKAVRAELESIPLTLAHNEDWRQGMGSSIATACRRLDEVVDGVLITLCDLWRLEQADLLNLVGAWRKDPTRIVASQWHDAFGPPVIFPASCFAELSALRGERGAKAVIAGHPDIVRFVPLDNARFDLDRPDDLDTARRD
jgi:CTP:molybdopterin cytidylyltransferase MocA